MNPILTAPCQTDLMTRRALILKTLSLGGLALSGLALPQLAAAADASEKKKGGGVNYTQFPMISVFTGAGANHHGTMSVEVGLYATDAKLTDQIKLNQPRLQDAYVTRLQGYAGNLNAASLVDIDYVAKQLQTVTDQILGRPGARVLLGSILLN